jgi:hypothetical protein
MPLLISCSSVSRAFSFSISFTDRSFRKKLAACERDRPHADSFGQQKSPH